MEKGMNAKQLARYRIGLFRDAANFRQPQRVPHFANVVTWKIYDAGYTLKEAFGDFSVMEKVVRHFLDTYTVDATIDLGIRNQFNVTETFSDTSNYYYTEEGVGIHDHSYCTAESLDEYLSDTDKYLWEKALPAKFDDWYEKPQSVWQQTFDEYLKYLKYILKIGSVAKKEYGIPSGAPNNPMRGKIEFGIEHLLESALGIKQLSLAMRREPDAILRFVKGWDERQVKPAIEKILSGKEGPDMHYCFDSSLVMLSHNILNKAQFEQYYWPSLEPLLQAYAKKKKNIRIYTEGSIARHAEYFKDIPKGVLTFHLDSDDPFELRQLLPNATIMGGLSTELLDNGTPEHCVERAKQLIDGLGRDGGFILSEGKMLSYKNDAKRENLLAVCDFANAYYLREG